MADMELIAKNAYAAYGAVTDHKNYQGLPMPEWENLTPKIREAWVAAAVNVWDAATATPKGIE